MTLTPLETMYEGYAFRSRLEARWAVFFDALGLKWRYEPEGFLLGDGVWYLPDFFVEGLGWLEIKPNVESDNGKWETFCHSNIEVQGFRAFRLTGDIPSPSFRQFPDGLSIEAFYGGFGGGMDEGYAWCLCPHCEKIGIEYKGRGLRMCRIDSKLQTSDSIKIKVGYIAARQARFEARR